MSDDVSELVEELSNVLDERGLRLAVAESCTGGELAQAHDRALAKALLDLRQSDFQGPFLVFIQCHSHHSSHVAGRSAMSRV